MFDGKIQFIGWERFDSKEERRKQRADVKALTWMTMPCRTVLYSVFGIVYEYLDVILTTQGRFRIKIFEHQEHEVSTFRLSVLQVAKFSHVINMHITLVTLCLHSHPISILAQTKNCF